MLHGFSYYILPKKERKKKGYIYLYIYILEKSFFIKEVQSKKKIKKLCPHPESNEGSSHYAVSYECDAVPLSHAGRLDWNPLRIRTGVSSSEFIWNSISITFTNILLILFIIRGRRKISRYSRKLAEAKLIASRKEENKNKKNMILTVLQRLV